MNRSSRMLGAAVTALALAGAAACSSSSTGSSSGAGSSSSTASGTAGMPSMSTMPSGGGSAPASAANTITIADFSFSGPLTVSPGAQITVTNKDSVMHTVTADSAGGFDVSVAAGGSATFTAPSTPGSYAFHCSIHPSMKHETLVVK